MSSEMRKSNVLTGVVLILGVAAFSGMMLFLQGYDPAPEGDPYTVVLQSAPGIAKNSAVSVAGLRVGKVESVEVKQTAAQAMSDGLAYATEVHVHVRIDPKFASGFTIHQNASASVVTAVFGRASLSINPGGPGVLGAAEGKPAIPFPEQGPRLIRGDTPPGLDELARRAVDISAVVKGLLTDVRSLVQDIEKSGVGETNREVRRLIQAVTERVEATAPMMEELQGAAVSARKTMDSLGATVEKSAGSIESTMQSVAGITAKADAFLGDRLGGLADSLDKALTQIAALASTSNAMVAENRMNLHATLGNVRDISANLKDMSAKLRKDPSIMIWGTDDKDNAADRKEGPRGWVVDEHKLRESGALPVRERE